MKNILFYKYYNLENLGKIKKNILNFCESREIKGKILIAKEGVNGCVSLENKKVNNFLNKMENIFGEIDFKITPTYSHDFKRIFVKIKKEIITSKFDIEDNNPAPYVEPKELEKWLEDDEVVMLDARNNYESRTGKFKNSITPDISKFSEFPDIIKSISHLKNKKIVTYCTGGIRCEKASAYLKKEGFTSVFQLHGGILKYGNEVGDKNWEGLCIVFDDRRAIEINPEKHRIVDVCKWCMLPEEDIKTCSKCENKFICCEKCYSTKDQKCDKICLNHHIK